MQPGEIHFHRQFYIDAETGEFRGKYLLALVILPSGDFVVRLLTSRQHGRPKVPPCFHGDPYPGFCMGVPGGPLDLDRETWLDLRAFDDMDAQHVARDTASGQLQLASVVDPAKYRHVAKCVAAANDTTRLQERAIRDNLAR